MALALLPASLLGLAALTLLELVRLPPAGASRVGPASHRAGTLY